MKEKSNPHGLGEFARENLQYPPADLSHFRSDELVGYYSYYNWVIPELTLGASLKLSLLLFDKVVAESDPGGIPEMTFEWLVREGKLSKKAYRILSQIIVPIHLVVPSFGLKDMFSPSGDSFLEFATEYYLDQEYRFKGMEPPSYDTRLLKDMRYLATDAALANWFALSRQLSCLFIPNSYEERILASFVSYLRVGRPEESHRDYHKFEIVVTRLLPSVQQLSVDEVLELRQHEYFSSFRLNTRQFVDRIDPRDNVSEVRRAINEQERRDIETLLDMFRPRPGPKLLRAVIGNLPIPLPLVPNPVGLYDAIDTVKKEARAAKDIGWLYFVRDFRQRHV